MTWLLITGSWLRVTGYEFLVVDIWLLVTGYWLLVDGLGWWIVWMLFGIGQSSRRDDTFLLV